MDKGIVWLVGSMEEIRQNIAIAGIGALTLLQLFGWYFNKDGVITALVAGGISAIVAYYFGKIKGSKTV
jgi:hypothetical protein